MINGTHMSDPFQQILLNRLEKFEDMVVYLHFYESETKQQYDMNMNTTISMVRSIIGSLKKGVFVETDIKLMYNLNNLYRLYREWLRKSKPTSTLWSIE